MTFFNSSLYCSLLDDGSDEDDNLLEAIKQSLEDHCRDEMEKRYGINVTGPSFIVCASPPHLPNGFY